jgi:hypothetical protein
VGIDVGSMALCGSILTISRCSTVTINEMHNIWLPVGHRRLEMVSSNRTNEAADEGRRGSPLRATVTPSAAGRTSGCVQTAADASQGGKSLSKPVQQNPLQDALLLGLDIRLSGAISDSGKLGRIPLLRRRANASPSSVRLVRPSFPHPGSQDRNCTQKRHRAAQMSAQPG